MNLFHATYNNTIRRPDDGLGRVSRSCTLVPCEERGCPRDHVVSLTQQEHRILSNFLEGNAMATSPVSIHYDQDGRDWAEVREDRVVLFRGHDDEAREFALAYLGVEETRDSSIVGDRVARPIAGAR